METQMRKKNAKSNAPDAANGHEKQLKEIQNLLFGEQLGDVEKEINTFRSEFDKRLKDMEKATHLSIEASKKEFNRQIATLTKTLEKMSASNDSSSEHLSERIDLLGKDLEGHRTSTESAQQAIQQQLASEADSLSSAMEHQHKALMEMINKTAQKLSDAKTDRKLLAKLLTTMAKNIEA